MNSNELEKKEYTLSDIEDFRKTFWRIYKRNDLIRKIVFGVCFVVLIFFFLIFPSVAGEQSKSAIAIQYGGALASLAVMLVYGLLMKKTLNAKLKDYFKIYYSGMNNFIFSPKGYSNIVSQEPGKIELADLNETQLYADLISVSSRGLTSFKFGKSEYSIVDCAGNTKKDKRIFPVFVGKLLRGNCSYKGSEIIIIYLKGSNKPLPPTNIDGLKVVLNNEKMNIYTNLKDWQKIITKKVISLLSEIKTNELLADVAISLHDSKQFVALGYDDPLMVPPLENNLDDKPMVQLKNDLIKAMAVMEELN